MQELRMDLERFDKEVEIRGAVGLNELVGVVIAFVVIAIVAGFGVTMLSEMKNNVNDTTAQQSIDSGVSAISTVTSYLKLIALAVVIGIVLTIVLIYLYRRFG